MLLIPCFKCHGSGWKDKQIAPLTPKKETFILLPCIECKGTGLVEFKVDEPPTLPAKE